MRVVWILLAIFFGLVLVAGVAAAIVIPRFVNHVASENANPVTREATAEKIARFTLPPGYHLRSATDMFVSRSATIVSNNDMVIQLTASTIPSDTKTARSTAMIAMNVMARALGCTMQKSNDDVITVRGKPYPFSVFACSAHGGEVRTEIGFVPAVMPQVQIIATTVGAPFDESAFHAFVSSMH